MPNEPPDSPSDEIIAATDMARTSTHDSDSAGEVAPSTRIFRFLHANFAQIRLAVLVCLLTLLLTFVLSQAYQRYAQLTQSRHVFYSTTGESFSVVDSFALCCLDSIMSRSKRRSLRRFRHRSANRIQVHVHTAS